MRWTFGFVCGLLAGMALTLHEATLHAVMVVALGFTVVLAAAVELKAVTLMRSRRFGMMIRGEALADHERIKELERELAQAREEKRCHECNAGPATRCAKCFHAVEDERDALKRENQALAKKFVDMKAYADCVELRSGQVAHEEGCALALNARHGCTCGGGS